jgi:predicted  nucleic acid-binding Zn-ribbon protein
MPKRRHGGGDVDGAQLEAQSAESLRRRIDELVTAHDRYRRENSRLATELDDTRKRLRMTEDDLGAARTSLRRMIREQTSEIAT